MALVKIAGAALNQTPADWSNNFANISDAINKAKAQNVKILCLPELCITGYGCEDLFLAEWFPNKAEQILHQLISLCDNITVSFGLPIHYEGNLYNCACLVKDKKILGFTAKQFLANDGVHYEPRWFAAWPHSKIVKYRFLDGNSYDFGDVIYDVEGTKVGFEICEDAWKSDSIRPACRHVKNKVDLILNPSASHFSFGKSDIRYNLIINSSATFNCTYLYANLLGNEAGRIIYDGEVLISHKGKLIQRNNRLSYNNVDLVSLDIDFTSGHIPEVNLTHDERDKEYEFWEATCVGLFDYLRKSKSKGFVLSLSGGADSSACAIMVSEMVKKGIAEIGAEAFIQKAGLGIQPEEIGALNKADQAKYITGKILICAYQATVNSGQATFESAQKLAESIGATFYHWNIDNELNGYSSTIEIAIGRELKWETDDITLQNIQARARSPIIWMLANIHSFLLITTSNRSEGDVGYATMDGDTSGSIAPIAGVDKHFIINWLKWAEENLDQPGLRYVNSITPTAELRPPDRHQTDEKDLMPYFILSEIEREAIRNRKSPLEVFQILQKHKLEDEQLLKQHIIKFFRMWSRNQWKRERIAPSFHLDDFNVDPRSWCRFPILSGGFEEELRELQIINSKPEIRNSKTGS